MKKRTGHLLITAAFLGCIGGLSAASLLKPQAAFSDQENRYLQKKPEFTLEGLLDGSYGTKYETYLSDQFPVRDRWIGVKVAAERLQRKEDTNGVYFGRDGYLIERFEEEDILTKQLTDNLEKLSVMTALGKEKLGQNHVRVMLLPSASSVISDKLPYLAAPYNQRNVEDKLLSQVDRSMVITIDDIFLGHEDEAVYYKTDHHWTALGAYYGYEAWAASMKLKPWSREKFRVEPVSQEFLGTVYSKVHVKAQPDTIELYLPKDAVEYKVYYDGVQEAVSGLYSYDKLSGKDKYAVYLDGNHGLTEIVNQNIDEERKGTSLLIIKDSFAHSFAPFAANHYERVYMMDLRYYNLLPSRFLEEYQVTDLLFMYQIPGFARETSVNKLR